MLRKSLMLFCTVCLFFTGQTLVYSAIIQGTISRDNPPGGVMTEVQVALLGENGDWLDITTDANSSGFYQITDVDEGNYIIQVRPWLYSDDDLYAVTKFPETVAAGTNTFDYTLEIGGNISGTVTPEVAPTSGDWWKILVELWDENGNYITDGWVENSSGEYRTNGVPSGTYYVLFKDQDNQYQRELYDNFPDWYYSPTPVTIVAGSTTPNIDASLHEASNSRERYYIEWVDIATVHNRKNTSNETYSFSFVSSGAYRFDGSPVVPDEITGYDVTSPSGSCQNNPFGFITWLRHVFTDRNADGLTNLDNERGAPSALVFSDVSCNLDQSHPAGDYHASMTFQNGQTASRSNSPPEALPLNTLEPVSGVSAVWDDASNELELSWVIPTPYPAESTYQIRVEPYNNGQYKNVQIRIRNLPATITSFTLDSGMTAAFNNPNNDQLRVEIRVEGPNNTQARTRQGYDFDSETGALSEAKISERPYDINGDGQTGLAESINILQIITTQ